MTQGDQTTEQRGETIPPLIGIIGAQGHDPDLVRTGPLGRGFQQAEQTEAPKAVPIEYDRAGAPAAGRRLQDVGPQPFVPALRRPARGDKSGGLGPSSADILDFSRFFFRPR